jgi:hypothetical protein
LKKGVGKAKEQKLEDQFVEQVAKLRTINRFVKAKSKGFTPIGGFQFFSTISGINRGSGVTENGDSILISKQRNSCSQGEINERR